MYNMYGSYLSMTYDNTNHGVCPLTNRPLLRDLSHYGNFWAAPCLIAAKGGRVCTEMTNFFVDEHIKGAKVAVSELTIYSEEKKQNDRRPRSPGETDSSPGKWYVQPCSTGMDSI